MSANMHCRIVPLLLLSASGCAELSTAAPPAEPLARQVLADDDPWAMVPAEADLILWADLDKLRASPWTRDSFARVAPQDVAGQGPAFEQTDKLDQILLAKLPALRDGASVLVGQGGFDREAMRRAFAQEPVETSTYRGTEIHMRGEEALAFFGRRTVFSGLAVAVRAALDCNAGVARAVDSESWLRQLRGELDRDKGAALPVATLYVRLQPATREALLREMGEGGDLEEFGGRVDLDGDLHAHAIGVTRTPQQAQDLAARLSERVREARTRPIVAALALGSVLDSVRFSVAGTRVHATLRVSEHERALIALKMALVAETLARMRKQRMEQPQP